MLAVLDKAFMCNKKTKGASETEWFCAVQLLNCQISCKTLNIESERQNLFLAQLLVSSF